MIPATVITFEWDFFFFFFFFFAPAFDGAIANSELNFNLL